MKTYYAGIYAKNKNTLVLQLVENKDCLNCEILEYFGPRITTKKRIKDSKHELLKQLKLYKKFANYKYLQID